MVTDDGCTAVAAGVTSICVHRYTKSMFMTYVHGQ